MSPAELERANTWLIEFVETIIEGVKWRREGDEHHVIGHGGLSINTKKGCWFQHSTGKGGWTVIQLVALLKGYSNTAATEWVGAFLRSHAGTGSTIPGDGDHGHEIESAALAQEIIDKLVDPAGTPAKRTCGRAV